MVSVTLKSLMHSPRSFRRGIKLIYRSLGRENVLVLGDSHMQVFSCEWLLRALPEVFFDVCAVNGATATGLPNVNSKTRTYVRFKDALARTKARRIIICIGEVDMGYVVWHRAQRHNQPVEMMLDFAVNSYRSLLDELGARGGQVICISTPLPTIKDGVEWGEVARARNDISATHRERTELTLEFNRRIAARCENLGFDYIDLDAESMGPDGLVKPELLNTNPLDHHYEKDAYAKLLYSHLVSRLVSEADRGSRS